MLTKKTILVLGAFLVSLMMISSVSAVQQVNSQSVVKVIEQKEKMENYIDNLYIDNEIDQVLNSVQDLPDKQLISNLKYKLDQFITKYGVGNNIDDFSWKNKPQKNLFTTIKNSIEDDIQTLMDDISNIETTYGKNIQVEDPNNENTEVYKNWNNGFIQTVSSTVWDFFKDYIKGDNFNSLKQSFSDTGIYDELEEYIGIALDTEGEVTFQYGSIIDMVMIFICYVVFMANYILFGPVGSQVTDDLVALLLGILLFVPASVSVIFHYLGENVINAGVAFISTLELFISFYGQALMNSLNFGLVGFLVWGLFAVGSFTVGAPIVIVAFVLTFISEFIVMSDDWEPGDIINIIPQYIHDIIKAAWEMLPNYGGYSQNKLANSVDNWVDIWPLPEPNAKPKSFTKNSLRSTIFFYRFN